MTFRPKRWITQAAFLACFCLAAHAQGQLSPNKNDAWSPDAQWEEPLKWMERASARSRIYMKGLMLPTEFKHVGEFLNIDKNEPMAVHFQKELSVNGKRPTQACTIGRSGEFAWSGWLSIAKNTEEESWVRFWLVAHEWAHCLDAQDALVHKKTTWSWQERQDGERRADAFATIALIARTGDASWFLRLAAARKNDGPTELHHTYPVFEKMVGEDTSEWNRQSVHEWWQTAKRVTVESRN